MDLVRIVNTRPTILHLPDVLTHTEVDGQGPRTIGIGSGKSLQPGGNNLEVAIWEGAKKNRTVKQWLDLNWITEGGDPSEPEGVQPPETLAAQTVSAAIQLAQEETKLVVLEKWLKTDKRPDVTHAIQRKIEALGGPKAPKK